MLNKHVELYIHCFIELKKRFLNIFTHSSFMRNKALFHCSVNKQIYCTDIERTASYLSI